MALGDATPADRFMLWVDAVGGYWVCLADELIVGQPGAIGSGRIFPSWPTFPRGTPASAATAKAT